LKEIPIKTQTCDQNTHKDVQGLIRLSVCSSGLKVFNLAFAVENNELARQIEDLENKGIHMSRSRTLLMSQHEELKKQLDEETKVRETIFPLTA